MKPDWKWYLAIIIIFSLVVGLNFTKPFGFFRESNPALVAINATYWEKDPDTRKQNIPVVSYAFDKALPPATQFDNTITTFGYAWFSVPYYFLKVTGIPAGPVGLRIFSVFWLLLTMVTIYILASQMSKEFAEHKTIVFITIALYVLSPVVMWYQVNGYVHETAVLPFYYAGWYFFHRLLHEKKRKWLWLAAACLFIGIQFDWLSFFQGVVMSACLLFSRKTQLPKWMFLVPGTFVFLGIAYIIYTYASWSSANDYFHFMRWKFGSRTVGQEGHSFLSIWPAKLNIVLFYVIGYGILLLWVVMGLRKKSPPFLWLMVITTILHHVVFWGFSSEHDYAALKMAFPLVFIAAIYISSRKKTRAMISLIIIVVFAIAQYLFLHNYSYRKGMYEDEHFFVKAGALLKSQPSDHVVFLNTENKYFPQVEFYGGRPYKMAVSAEDARIQLLKKDSTAKGVYIEVSSKRYSHYGKSVYLNK